MSNSGVHHIRPAGRHILTIGRDLIQDHYAAIVELVKNAYDADASNCEVSIDVANEQDTMITTISDNGHGMSRDTVINKWLVPSTKDKLDRKLSPSGRAMQGRKGIGRYAASILGDTLMLETTDTNGMKTAIYIEWKDFEEAEFLADVEVLVETVETDQSPGTTITIEGASPHAQVWQEERQIKNLYAELKRLVSPIEIKAKGTDNENPFQIYLSISGVSGESDTPQLIEIHPYDVFDYYDYRIKGTVNADGLADLEFTNQRAKNTLNEPVSLSQLGDTGCGDIRFDIRVFDREADAIEQLIHRGLKNPNGQYIGKNEARSLLNEINGIGVYRNKFRIRPLGDPGYDWLQLDKRRVQTPARKIGSNQVIGYVHIESEELSGLEEKSARDGLKDNGAYARLKYVTQEVINALEHKRYVFRKKTGLSRKTIKIDREISEIGELGGLWKTIESELTKSGTDQQVITKVSDAISEEENRKSQIAEDLRQAVAIYQGQATLGKIINVVLHEGRKPLNFFKNQSGNIRSWSNSLKKSYDQFKLDKVVSVTDEFADHSEVLNELFQRLDPLASGRRGPKKEFVVNESLEKSFNLFSGELTKNKISYTIDCDQSLRFFGWRSDFYIILTNLIDNSIFWLQKPSVKTRSISVQVECDDNGDLEYIDYRDTGPGIEASLIESEVIFDPEFSTKTEGSGLGLAIAGESAARNNLSLKAFDSVDGAYFRLQPIPPEES